MEYYLPIQFGSERWIFSVNEDPDLIGHHYVLSKAKDLEFRTLRESYCETDLHYRKSKDPIPKGELVEPIDFWRNYYGGYLRCEWGGQRYDIETSNIQVNYKQVH